MSGISADVMQRVWKTEQEILDVFHAFCEENGLRYSLAYGTLLGAVRHKGFIPWDDDIDVIMPREDYNRLIEIWDTKAPAGYLCQYPDDASFAEAFMKIRKDHTAFIQSEKEKTASFQTGLFIDILPMDRQAPGRFARMRQFAAAMINLLFVRGHVSGKTGAVAKLGKILLRLPASWQLLLRRRADRTVQKWNACTAQAYVASSSVKGMKRPYKPDLFEDLQPISFCDKTYLAIKDTDAYLRRCYGDYMQLPPENERVWTHHPILIDFEHNYGEPSDSFITIED